MAAFIRSVSMFLMRGRRASRATDSNKLKQSASADQIHPQVQRRGTFIDKKQAGSGTQQKKMQTNKGNKCSSAQLIESLKKRTHFSKREIEALLKLHRSLASASSQKKQIQRAPKTGNSLDGGRPVLDRECFRELLHNSLDLTEEKLMERIFHAFDKRSEGVIDGERWVLGMSVLLKGTLAEKQAYCFSVYDLNGDGFISKEEILHLLAGCLATPAAGDEDPEEGVRDLTDVALRKMDVDRDGKLSFNDYVEAIRLEPLLLEAFGPCLPSEQTCESFLATLLKA